MDRRTRMVVALLAPVAILLAVRWFDVEVLPDIERQSSATFDARPFAWVMPVGYLATAAGVLAVAYVARWSRSLLVGIAYTLAGGFLIFLPAMTWTFTAEINGAPPVLPEPVARFVGDAYSWTGYGVIGAFFLTAAGMLLAGLGAIGMAVRRRAAGGSLPTDQPDGGTG